MRQQDSWGDVLVPVLVVAAGILFFALTHEDIKVPDCERVGSDAGFWETSGQYHNRKQNEELLRRQVQALEKIAYKKGSP